MSQVTPRTPHLETKLPAVGTTIFTVMSALAAEKGAVNLGQGFPDFDCDPKLVQSVTDAMTRGLNQYPPMTGVPVLREAVAAKIAQHYGRQYSAADEITITAGATQAIITAILAVVRPGDEHPFFSTRYLIPGTRYPFLSSPHAPRRASGMFPIPARREWQWSEDRQTRSRRRMTPARALWDSPNESLRPRRT